MRKHSDMPLGKLDMGIPKYDKEPTKEAQPVKDSMHRHHDVSMDEALRKCGGSGNSASIKKGGY